MSPVRKPIVAGSFYEGNKEKLRRQIEECFKHPAGHGVIPEKNERKHEESRLRAVLCPHAGYMYSGPVASWSFAEIAKSGVPDTVVLLGPNHRGVGMPASVSEMPLWETPLGALTVNNEMADALCGENVVVRDDAAHRYEHSLEVQLPFLQYLFKDKFKIVPVVFLHQTYSIAKKMAEALHKLSREFNFLVVASSDMTHYEPQAHAEKKDNLALSHILRLDGAGLEKAIYENEITMCGYCPVMTVMEYARLSGIKNARLLKYATSGDVSGDKSRVVGYASVSFSSSEESREKV